MTPWGPPSYFLLTSGSWIVYAYFSWYYHWLGFLGFYLHIPSFNLTEFEQILFSFFCFCHLSKSEHPGTLYISTTISVQTTITIESYRIFGVIGSVLQLNSNNHRKSEDLRKFNSLITPMRFCDPESKNNKPAITRIKVLETALQIYMNPRSL